MRPDELKRRREAIRRRSKAEPRGRSKLNESAPTEPSTGGRPPAPRAPLPPSGGPVRQASARMNEGPDATRSSAGPARRRRARVRPGAVVLCICTVLALVAAGFFCAQLIPARKAPASGGRHVSAEDVEVASLEGAGPASKGLNYMPPRSSRTSAARQGLQESLRNAGLLGGYSMPPDRLVFLPSGAAQYVPAAPMPTAPVPGRSVYRGNPSKPRVALTFDDAYTKMDILLELLVRLRVPATIFPTGGAVDSNPAVVKQAREMGFEIANHSYTHPSFTRSSNDLIVREVLGCDAAVTRATGAGTVAYLRPPGGAVDARVEQVLGSIGYTSIMWTHDTIDWSSSTTADQLYARATEGVENGDIILMHSQGKYTLELLPRIVQTLRDKGFELTTVAGVLSDD